MKDRLNRESLNLVTLATLVMGIDYVLALFFPQWGEVASLNRIVFLGIFAYDYLNNQYKYRISGPIYVAFFFIFLSWLPFMFYAEKYVTGFKSIFDEVTGFFGIFAYMLFFYANSRNTKIASRICGVLFFCSFVMTAYLLGVVLGITGEAASAWRGNLQYFRASGAFDPNLVMVYMISLFAFGPLLALHSSAFAGLRQGVAIIAILCVGGYTVLQLNSRSGTIVLGVTLCISMLFRTFLVPNRKTSSRFYTLCFVFAFVTVPIFMQFKYGIFNTIVAIYGETHLVTDTSFFIRLTSYKYLGDEVLFGASLPNILGNPSGYSDYWNIVGGSFYPHCSFVDMYIKGGVLYLCIFLYFYVSAVLTCMRRAIWWVDGAVEKKAVFAGLFAFLVGIFPMMASLSIETNKIIWGMLGCALGLVAQYGGDIRQARKKRISHNV